MIKEIIKDLKTHFVLLGALILFFIFLLLRLLDLNFFANVRQASFDYYQDFFPISYEESPVVIVAIDEKSLEKYGQFPWPRTYLASLVDKIGKAGAIIISIDILLPEEDRTSLDKIAKQYQLDKEKFKDFYFQLSNDQLLSNVFRQHNVVMGISPAYNIQEKVKPLKQRVRYTVEKKGNINTSSYFHYPKSIHSLNILEQNARGIGNLGYIPEKDGVVRKTPMMIKIEQTMWPSLELEMIRTALNQKKYYLTEKYMQGHFVSTGNYSIPTDQQSQKWIYYKDTLPQQFISAADVLDDTFNAQFIQNKIVYIGATAVGLSDIVATPRSPAVAGVEVRANIMENILSNHHITKPQWSYILEISLLLLTTGIIFFTSIKIKPALSLPIFGVCQIVLPTISFLIFRNLLVLLDFTFGFLLAFITLAASYFINFLHKNYLAKEEKMRRQKMLKELEFAQEIQSFLIPTEHPQPDIIYGINIPAKQVSGDYFDYLTREDGCIIFTLADVSGKGAASGLMMSKGSSLFRIFAKQNISLSEIIIKLNHEICESTSSGMFITMVVGCFDPQKKQVRLINAGHEPVVFIDSNKQLHSYPANFRPVGIMPIESEESIESTTIDVEEGKIFIYTDGVTEGYINANKEELGTEGVEKIIKENYQSSLKDIIDIIVQTLSQADHDRRDDITCLGIKL